MMFHFFIQAADPTPVAVVLDSNVQSTLISSVNGMKDAALGVFALILPIALTVFIAPYVAVWAVNFLKNITHH